MADAHSFNGNTEASGTAAARARERAEESASAERQERIGDLRRGYLDGSYTVNAADLSAAILQKHLAE